MGAEKNPNGGIEGIDPSAALAPSPRVPPGWSLSLQQKLKVLLFVAVVAVVTQCLFKHRFDYISCMCPKSQVDAAAVHCAPSSPLSLFLWINTTRDFWAPEFLTMREKLNPAFFFFFGRMRIGAI